MSKGNLSVVAIQEQKAVPPIARKARRKFPFLAGAVVLIALAAIGVAMRASKTQPIQQPSNKTAEMAQAQAQLKVAQAASNLAEVTYRRSQDLFTRDSSPFTRCGLSP